MVDKIDEAKRFWIDAEGELIRAQNIYTPFASAHEAESVLREEFEELVAWVHRKPRERNVFEMRYELVQIAAMAARFAVEVCETGLVNER